MTSLFWSNLVNGKRSVDTAEQSFFTYLNKEEVVKIFKLSCKIVNLQGEIKLGKQRKALKKSNVFHFTIHYWVFKSIFILASDYYRIQ
jgi:hypothetical protein